jgi:hypothetical protein
MDKPAAITDGSTDVYFGPPSPGDGKKWLMSRPRLLLLDEPSLGLAPLIVRQILEAIREINKRQRS